MRVAELWRFPVKSLAGERLARAHIGNRGIPGDRLVWVCGPEGVRTARRHHPLLGLRGTLDDDGEPLIDGHPWRSAQALTLVRQAAGEDAWLEPADEDDRFDILPLLVATDGAIAAFGRDGRRLRPNIVIGEVPGVEEFDWPGSVLEIGDARIHIHSRRGRCPMTTVDPDSLDVDPEVLKDIGRRFNGRLALNAEVLAPGAIASGDAARLESSLRADRPDDR
jgi:uncharacterized protein YcbX